VDVTTVDPGDAALEGIGQRAVIGEASLDWYATAGGIAYVNSFGRRGMPCYVFSASLGPNNPKVRISKGCCLHPSVRLALPLLLYTGCSSLAHLVWVAVITSSSTQSGLVTACLLLSSRFFF
jgi:hypothetical protein